MGNWRHRTADTDGPRPREDLVAKLVAMGIDSGAIPWNQWTPGARKCLNCRVGGRRGLPALALIIRWS